MHKLNPWNPVSYVSLNEWRMLHRNRQKNALAPAKRLLANEIQAMKAEHNGPGDDMIKHLEDVYENL